MTLNAPAEWRDNLSVMKPRQLFIENPVSGQLRLTRAGMDRYGPRFARVGVGASKIRSRAELEAATDASFMRELHELTSESRGTNPELDRILDGLLEPDRSN